MCAYVWFNVNRKRVLMFDTLLLFLTVFFYVCISTTFLIHAYTYVKLSMFAHFLPFVW